MSQLAGWLVQLPLERVFEPSNIPRTSSTYESADRPAPSSSSAEAHARALAFEFICPLVKTLCEFVGADAERSAHVFDVGGNRSDVSGSSSLPSGWSEAVYELALEFFTFCLRHGFWILLSALDHGTELGIRFCGRQERLTCTDERRVCERRGFLWAAATTDSPPSVRSQRLCG
jgi:hypothetical protein